MDFYKVFNNWSRGRKIRKRLKKELKENSDEEHDHAL